MPLPKIATPEFEIKLHSHNEPIRYRPFLMKEEKLLLMALESKNEDTMINSVKSIIKSCTLPDQKINFDNIPLFDLEYWFLNLRSKSVGENIKLVFKCTNCEESNNVDINIDDIKLFVSENHSNMIKLTEDISVEMKYPSIKQFNMFQRNDRLTEQLFEMVRECIKTIYHKDEVFDAKVQSKKELDDFILSLTQDQFGHFIDYFDTMPKLRHDVTFNCVKCSERNMTVIQGIDNFFLSP